MAVGLQADVTIFDKNPAVLERLSAHFGAAARLLYAHRAPMEQAVATADLVVGAVLVPGAAAPRLVTREMLGSMKTGAVLVDVAIDQGGCFETSHPTTHDDPTYVVDGIVHYCVANMPGAVARTSTYALNNATLGHVLRLANLGWRDALAADRHLRAGLSVCNGRLTCAPVADAQHLEYLTPEAALAA
jgi:alanine dehydrogenase